MRAVERDRLAFGACYLLLLPVYLAPLAVTRFLPGLDLPFHLSMVDMLSKSGRSDSPYAPFYEGTPHLGPYAAYYWALWLLGKWVSLTFAHKLVIGAYVAAFPLAAASLLGACRRSRVPALLAFPLAYNLALHYGFVSFSLSLPVLLALLSRLASFLLAPRPQLLRVATTAALAVLLFLCHLQNFLYGLCASIAFVVFSGAPWRRRLLAFAAFAPALGAMAWWQVSARFEGDPLQERKSVGFALGALKWARMADLDGGLRPLHLDLKRRLVDELPAHVLRGFADLVDIRACQTLLVLVAFYFFLALAGRGQGHETADRARLRLATWVAFCGAALAYLALPHHLPAFEITTFYPRFAVLVVVMMLPLVPGGLRRVSARLPALVPLPALLLCALYGRQLVRHYRLYGAEVADFSAVVDALPPGAKTLGLVFDRQSAVMRIESALMGLPNFYVAARSAPGSMTPLSYCGMRHIPCRKKRPMDALPDSWPWAPELLRADKAIPFFDYFLVRSPPPGAEVFGDRAEDVVLVSRKGTWTAYARMRAPAKP